MGLTAVFTLMFWTTAPELQDYPPALLLLLLALDRVTRYFAEGRIAHLVWSVGWDAWAQLFVFPAVVFPLGPGRDISPAVAKPGLHPCLASGPVRFRLVA
ncbi:MAG: hypothetical protein VYE68_14410, partial [Acidobacteriota bacterium]|nr:hypothetical protein [Acidobacteriota bacterium]